MDSSDNEDEEGGDEDDDEAGLYLSWLLVGVWHEAAHKVGLAVVKSRLRKDDRARFRCKRCLSKVQNIKVSSEKRCSCRFLM